MKITDLISRSAVLALAHCAIKPTQDCPSIKSVVDVEDIERLPAIDAVPVVPRGYISINLLKSKLDNEFGDNWIFDHSEPKTIEGCDSWLRRSMMRALWIWMCNTEAAQHGEKLAGKWVNNSSGVLACSVCGIPKKYACMEDGSCASCGAKMDGESEEDTNGHQTD